MHLAKIRLREIKFRNEYEMGKLRTREEERLLELSTCNIYFAYKCIVIKVMP